VFEGALASFLIKVISRFTLGLTETVVYFEIIRCSFDAVKSLGVGVFIIKFLR
jgi:hypothetical protein